MTPTLILSPLSVALADSLARHVHFLTVTMEGRALCRLCGTTWNLDEYVADSGVCPGSVQRGFEPVPGAEHRLTVGGGQ